jgi:hypothetical protein
MLGVDADAEEKRIREEMKRNGKEDKTRTKKAKDEQEGKEVG